MSRKLTIAIQMDALTTVNYRYDSSLTLAAGALRRGHKVYIYQPHELSWQPGLLSAPAQELSGLQIPLASHVLGPREVLDLSSVDVILLRQDPPYNLAYITTTHLLELVADKVLVLNNPKAVRDAPEKLLVQRFPDLIPPTLITRNRAGIAAFRATHGDIILKPLFGHAGSGVFHIRPDDENYTAALDALLGSGLEPIIVQKYLPTVREGDRRIVLFDGEPVGVFARVPVAGEARANTRYGSQLVASTLTTRERDICTALAPTLKQTGLFFAGIDVIGGWLTEINVTSPAGIAQLNELNDTQLEDEFWQQAEAKLS
jgi:glutathione synthase